MSDLRVGDYYVKDGHVTSWRIVNITSEGITLSSPDTRTGGIYYSHEEAQSHVFVCGRCGEIFRKIQESKKP